MKIYSTKDKEYIDNELKKCQMKMDDVYEYLNNTDKKLKEHCQKEIERKLKENPKKYIKNIVNFVKTSKQPNKKLIQKGGKSNILIEKEKKYFRQIEKKNIKEQLKDKKDINNIIYYVSISFFIIIIIIFLIFLIKLSQKMDNSK